MISNQLGFKSHTLHSLKKVGLNTPPAVIINSSVFQNILLSLESFQNFSVLWQNWNEEEFNRIKSRWITDLKNHKMLAAWPEIHRTIFSYPNVTHLTEPVQIQLEFLNEDLNTFPIIIPIEKKLFAKDFAKSWIEFIHLLGEVITPDLFKNFILLNSNFETLNWNIIFQKKIPLETQGKLTSDPFSKEQSINLKFDGNTINISLDNFNLQNSIKTKSDKLFKKYKNEFQTLINFLGSFPYQTTISLGVLKNKFYISDIEIPNTLENYTSHIKNKLNIEKPLRPLYLDLPILANTSKITQDLALKIENENNLNTSLSKKNDIIYVIDGILNSTFLAQSDTNFSKNKYFNFQKLQNTKINLRYLINAVSLMKNDLNKNLRDLYISDLNSKKNYNLIANNWKNHYKKHKELIFQLEQKPHKILLTNTKNLDINVDYLTDFSAYAKTLFKIRENTLKSLISLFEYFNIQTIHKRNVFKNYLGLTASNFTLIKDFINSLQSNDKFDHFMEIIALARDQKDLLKIHKLTNPTQTASWLSILQKTFYKRESYDLELQHWGESPVLIGNLLLKMKNMSIETIQKDYDESLLNIKNILSSEIKFKHLNFIVKKIEQVNELNNMIAEQQEYAERYFGILRQQLLNWGSKFHSQQKLKDPSDIFYLTFKQIHLIANTEYNNQDIFIDHERNLNLRNNHLNHKKYSVAKDLTMHNLKSEESNYQENQKNQVFTQSIPDKSIHSFEHPEHTDPLFIDPMPDLNSSKNNNKNYDIEIF